MPGPEDPAREGPRRSDLIRSGYARFASLYIALPLDDLDDLDVIIP